MRILPRSGFVQLIGQGDRREYCRFVSIRSQLRENYSLNPAEPAWFEFDPRDGWIQTESMMTEELELVSMKITRKFKKIELEGW